MKKLTSIIISICLFIVLITPVAFANGDDGKIDLYEVFSNKLDKMKTEVGSRIYKWSMHLPDDAIIYKSERANFFHMSTNSYNASVELEVNKNKEELTLEEMLYNIQNRSNDRYNWGWGDKEYVVDIAEDNLGQRYIRTIKTNQVYDYYMVDEAAEEFRDYIENRIYISNNYTYNLTIRMGGTFYREHEEMFDKLVSSFRLSFDEKNPYIKELSDSVSTSREYKNTSYGWELVMSPYWKVEGTPNARHQTFSPVYSDEELNENEMIEEKKEEEFKVPEGINVRLISSSEKGESASEWAKKEIKILKDNYNDEVYEILKNEVKRQGDFNTHHVVVRYKTVTKNPYIVHNIYVVGNGYKYLVSATMMEDKYQDPDKRSSFEDMINSFRLDKKYLSKYLGRIISAESIMNLNASKELKMKKYDFKTEVTKRWNTSNYGYDYYYDDYYIEYEMKMYRGNISNNEYINAFEPTSNIRLNMSAGLDTDDINEIITQKAQRFLRDDEIRMGLARLKIQSTEYNGTELYYIEKEYDINAINKFVNEDETKIYDLENLRNEYEYVIKIGKDTYTQNITLNVANMTSANIQKIKDIWKNTFINKVNYSKLYLKWKQHDLEEFDKDKKQN